MVVVGKINITKNDTVRQVASMSCQYLLKINPPPWHSSFGSCQVNSSTTWMALAVMLQLVGRWISYSAAKVPNGFPRGTWAKEPFLSYASIIGDKVKLTHRRSVNPPPRVHELYTVLSFRKPTMCTLQLNKSTYFVPFKTDKDGTIFVLIEMDKNGTIFVPFKTNKDGTIFVLFEMDKNGTIFVSFKTDKHGTIFVLFEMDKNGTIFVLFKSVRKFCTDLSRCLRCPTAKKNLRTSSAWGIFTHFFVRRFY